MSLLLGENMLMRLDNKRRGASGHMNGMAPMMTPVRAVIAPRIDRRLGRRGRPL
jgi:hypothetical protein